MILGTIVQEEQVAQIPLTVSRVIHVLLEDIVVCLLHSGMSNVILVNPAYLYFTCETVSLNDRLQAVVVPVIKTDVPSELIQT